MYNGRLNKYTNTELAGFTHEQLAGNAELIFVYDRTKADVEHVKELNKKYIDNTITDEEKAEWSKGIVRKNSLAYELGIRGAQGLKGALNLADIDRIEWNTAVIADLLGTAVEAEEWNYNDIPREADYKRIRENTQKLRNAWFTLTQAPDIPAQPLNTYQKWNDIEKILHDVYTAYMAFLRSRYYCGAEIYAGEGAGDL